MIEGLHHVQLAMPTGQESIAIGFYQEVLGITHVPKPSHLTDRGGCWFESGEVRIHLGVERQFAPAAKAHPALITSRLDEVVGRLEATGAEVVTDQPLNGFRRVYTSDPFGNRIELMQPED